MTDTPRLIEHAFPLKQTSLDSVHEKNVRHGHISTLHIWPARRPLAACRAALIATLLPDPSVQPKPEGMSEDEWQKEILRRRQELCEKIGGKVVKKIERKKMPNGQIVEREKEVTEGGILHWGLETEKKELLNWFRQEIEKAYDGRAPKVLDPFAGGGAIPLEAMRLGCEATAVDINPVAWFILKCTLEYPQKFAGKKHPLPPFILKNQEFMEEFFKAQGMNKNEVRNHIEKLGHALNKGDQITMDFSGKDNKLDADLAWHVRAWGQWVLDHTRRELAKYYPTYADFETLMSTGRDIGPTRPYEKQPMRLVPLKENGTPDVDSLNADFSKEYLDDKRNPRWIAKPTVAYLWARTVKCKNCRAVIPLLKTRWLCKKEKKRVLLTLEVEYEPQSMVKQGVGQASLPGVSYSVQNEGIQIYKRNLPHWRMSGATYFVTWRLNELQPGLQPEERERVASALRHFDGERYVLHGYVVMDDHVHVIVQPMEDQELRDLNHSWKSYTANQLQRKFNRVGSVWQDESWDRIVRNEEEYWEKMQYIQNNPQKRWAGAENYQWTGFPLLEKEQEMTEGKKATGRDACPTSSTLSTNAAPLTRSIPPNSSTIPYVVFGIDKNVPVKGGNPAQRRENDKRLGEGTMSRSGAKCPCCGTIMTMEDIRLEGQAGRLEAVNTVVVVDGREGKEYRLPTPHELELVGQEVGQRMGQGVGQGVGQASLPDKFLPGKETGTEACRTIVEDIQNVFAEVPFGMPEEETPKGGSGASRAFSVDGYGLDRWNKLFTPRQLLSLGTFIKSIRAARRELNARGEPPEKIEAINAYLACGFDRMLDFNSSCLSWITSVEAIGHTFVRYALPITWDYSESAVVNYVRGSWEMSLEACIESYNTITKAMVEKPPSADILNQSALRLNGVEEFDIVLTDPPYYDAIPYSDLMDFFLVWLRRNLFGLTTNINASFEQPWSPKWKNDTGDGELIDDASRHNGDRLKSKAVYEAGMAMVFKLCHQSLSPSGLFVIVFAHKNPDAWETLVSAIIQAGFVVDGSWPIQTEQVARMRAQGSAALASSVWLVCRKRSSTARPGWDNQVLEEMRQNIRERLREYWDAGIRGPDFVWAATGPALEAYSKHPVVRKANEPGTMTVSEFLTHVRRMVVDFVVGRVLSTGETQSHQEEERPEDTVQPPLDNLDPVTAYYLLHRHDFGLEEAPAGACILYAISCGVSDKELAETWNLIGFTKGKAAEEGEDEEADAGAETGPDAETESGSKVKLKTWVQRKGNSLGFDVPGGKPIPLIDRVHCLMHLWKAGDLHKVDEYLDGNGLRRQELFKRLLQSLIELSPHASEERSLLESISNHIQARGVVREKPASLPGFEM